MNARSRSRLVLGATLLLGMLLGALLVGAVGQWRAGRGGPGPDGFIRHIERVIGPRDEEQRRAVLPILEAAALRNEEIVGQGHEQLRATLHAMIEQLEPLLDADQLERLRREERPPRRGPDRFAPPPPRR